MIVLGKAIRGPVATALAVGLLAILILFFLHLMVQVNRVEMRDNDADGQALSACIEKYKTSSPQVSELYGLSTFCFGKIASQLKLDEEKIIRDNYIFQRNENVVLLYMVVLITLSGVALAGLQLLASYSLASRGRGELAGGGEVTYSAEGVSFKSSVVGLVILAMSFAFFLVFILYVYTFTYPSSDAQSGGSSTSSSKQSKTLLPAPPPAKSVQSPAPSAPSDPH